MTVKLIDQIESLVTSFQDNNFCDKTENKLIEMVDILNVTIFGFVNLMMNKNFIDHNEDNGEMISEGKMR
jgi:hypothetical protein